jgi:pimeloyl-ACP methyl ester carboxylesterase
MAMENQTSNLDRIQKEIARGDLYGLRAAILELSRDEEALFAQELGSELLERTRRRARRARRADKRGHVVVVHGIMGSMLDVVDPSGDQDRVWTHALRLAAGRIEDLELGPNEQNAKPNNQVLTAGLHRKTYVPLLLELDEEWNVRPFAFDWREDIERSADKLAAEIRAFAPAKPVHLVVHSMGGLVSRSMVKRHPDLWQAMQDPSAKSAGGRLIMLGTPNHGSYAIPLALSGKEWLERALEIVDVRHDMQRLLEILSSFPGSYQMLPSPLIELKDDHDQLYLKDKWGDLPVREALLQKARRFHENLRDVVAPDRFIYIAGYDQKTPCRIQIEKPGRFLFQKTRDGDGRVPHELGLLPDVPTFWVEESHGDLPKNEKVLDGIHDLLKTGQTDVLERTRPTRRGIENPDEWVSAEKIDVDSEQIEILRERSVAAQSRGERAVSVAEDLEIEGMIAKDYLGRVRRMEVKATKPKLPKPPSIDVEVIWGDITRVEGDVYTVGHYQDVLPQKAELALDKVVSNRDDDLVITKHTQRGLLRGALGDVNFFPWGDPKHRRRVVAVAGMGRPGSFSMSALRRLIRELVLSVSSLPNVKTVCSVLIGSGEGTLEIHDAVRSLVDGMVDTISAATVQTQIQKVRLVELEKGRAHEALKELREAAADPAVTERLKLNVAAEVSTGEGGQISDEAALIEVLAASSRALKARKGAKARQAIEATLEGIPDRGTREKAREVLSRLEAASSISAKPKKPTSQEISTRISVLEEGGTIRVAAISETATVSERPVSVDTKLIGEIVASMNNPDIEPPPNFPTFLLRLVFPRDFRSLLENETPFVFELNRMTAPIHWEMLARTTKAEPDAEPLGVQVPVARQLRTSYSPPPAETIRPQERLKALLVGDPGDPKQGHNLPGARDEAVRVCEILRAHGVEVTPLIGAPNAMRNGLPNGCLPATRMEVLSQLMHGRWDILHYCGHGDFDPKNPQRAGWVFGGGLLTAGEVERLDEVPALIVANACLSARTSQKLAGGDQVDLARREAGLLPSLADEFFHLGVRNYIGTSWEVNDIGAVKFAEIFYGKLLGSGRRSCTVGEGMLAARKELWARRHSFGKLWAAYQHTMETQQRAFRKRRMAHRRSIGC